jgi:hypothetical protein
MNTCRFCKDTNFDKGHKYRLIKYGVRHYAHPDCALQSVGKVFFERLTLLQLEAFPALAAASAGLLEELIAASERRRVMDNARRG